MILYKDPIYNFTEIFNQDNGLLIRSNVLDAMGRETDVEPEMRSFPELVDIGIMSKCHVANKYCAKFGVDCYQADKIKNEDMSLNDFKVIIEQCKNKALQVALGGNGDPNKHDHFIEMLKCCRKNNIVPNLTTTGINLTDIEIKAMKKYCGAVAVSMYSKLEQISQEYIETNPDTILAIKNLINENIITNIHYVISTKTIDDAILRLKQNKFPKGVNAVVFLLYKPVGLGNKKYMINNDDPKLELFFELLNAKKYPFKVGFDTCFSPLINKFLVDYNSKTIEFCEATKFSCYISSDLKMYPCSFIQKPEYEIDLNNQSIQKGWFSKQFESFRNINNTMCKNCNKKGYCFGGCRANLNQFSCLQKKKGQNINPPHRSISSSEHFLGSSKKVFRKCSETF